MPLINSEKQTRLKFEDYLAETGTLTYSNVGRSMMPLLREGRDLFTVERKTSSRCKVGDVVLYRRPPDKYVLHRIIQVRENDYVILGDNCVAKEYGITDDDILGIMTSFVRNGQERSVKSFSFRLYTFIILHTISLRIFLKRLICKFKNR
ncbi:MAG: S24/S26 family peptidase [Synergistaceae bacterium]|nr:S24/S26 family peptidase [Synergistaceae bacterium]